MPVNKVLNNINLNNWAMIGLYVMLQIVFQKLTGGG
jgi:hypothetical protein